MGDLVTCRGVLTKAQPGRGADQLFLVLPPDNLPRIIPCRPVGSPAREETGPEWQYEERDGRLYLTPSLLATCTGFHTDYHWSCDYVVCPDGESAFRLFYQINPQVPQDA